MKEESEEKGKESDEKSSSFSSSFPSYSSSSSSSKQKKRKGSTRRQKRKYKWEWPEIINPQIDVNALPNIFSVWIVEDISETSLQRARDWGELQRKVKIRVFDTPDLKLAILEKSGEILCISWAKYLHEVLDSSRYYSLKVPSGEYSEKERYIGIAFVTKAESFAFLHKLYFQRVYSKEGVFINSTTESSYGEVVQDSLWLSLSDEVILAVFSFLETKDLCNVENTCLRWMLIARDRQLWENLFHRHHFHLGYKTNVSKDCTIAWKEIYAREYRKRHPARLDLPINMESDLVITEDKFSNDSSREELTEIRGPIRLVVVGDSCGRGKTELLMKYSSLIEDPLSPVPADMITGAYDGAPVIYRVGSDHEVKLVLWDSSGTEQYDRLRPLFYAGTDAFLITFSLVDRESFESIVDRWVPECTHYCPGIPFVLVGINSNLRNDPAVYKRLCEDEKPPVSTIEGMQLASQLAKQGCMWYVECSLDVEGEGNVLNLFRSVVKSLIVQDARKKKKKSSNAKCIVQ